MFLTLVYSAFKEELDKILRYEKRSKKRIEALINERENLKIHINDFQEKLKIINEKLRESEEKENPCDLTRYNLTPKEYQVLEQLAITRETNKYIAGELHMSEATVKHHLHSIFRKTDIDNRSKLIELCKNNFSERFSPSLENQ